MNKNSFSPKQYVRDGYCSLPRCGDERLMVKCGPSCQVDFEQGTSRLRYVTSENNEYDQYKDRYINDQGIFCWRRNAIQRELILDCQIVFRPPTGYLLSKSDSPLTPMWVRAPALCLLSPRTMSSLIVISDRSPSSSKVYFLWYGTTDWRHSEDFQQASPSPQRGAVFLLVCVARFTDIVLC